jgi:hypothetical protein
MKKFVLIFIGLAFVAGSVYGMDSSKKKNPIPKEAIEALKKNQLPKIISVKHPQLTTTFEYNEATTIGGIKMMLYDREGIPTNQQKLVAVTQEGLSYGFGKSRSDSLSDDRKLVNVVDTFDTHQLELSIKLNPTHNSNSSNNSKNLLN